MDQQRARARLMRSLAVMNDALLVAVTRTGEACDAAEPLSEELADALGQIHEKLYLSQRILDEILAERPPAPAAD